MDDDPTLGATRAFARRRRDPRDLELPEGPRPTPGPRSVAECPEFADSELGAVVRLRLQGFTVDAVAVELGLTSTDALAGLVRQMESMGGNVHRGRRRHIGAEAEAELRGLRAQGQTVRALAERYGVSDGGVVYVLAHPRPGP